MADTPLTLLMVHAHPDDEALATGGVYARAASEGIRTVLVCCTRGEEGEVLDPALDPAEARGRLAEIRDAELREACGILGIEHLRYLDYRDSGMAGTSANQDPRNFHNANRGEAAERLVRILREFRPDVVVTYDRNGNYGHPDHIAAHEVTVAATRAAAVGSQYPEASTAWQVKKLYYLAFSLSRFLELQKTVVARGLVRHMEGENEEYLKYMTPDEDITTTVDVRDLIDRKMAAVRAHRSQIQDNHPMLAIPDDLITEFWGHESFTRGMSQVPTPEFEDDLFAGLR